MPRQAALILTAVLLTTAAFAQAPSTDLFLLPIDGSSVGEPTRLTDRDGYDNQPQFLADGSAIVYSSIEADGSTDIVLHDLASGAARKFTDTAESEYSPTPMPDGEAISVVRDYGDLVQQLWRFPLDGGEPELLLGEVGPIGYHAWIDDDELILFILGETMTLQRAAVGAAEGTVLGESPGRALARIPDSTEMSYVDKSSERWRLTAIDAASGERRALVETRPGREDYAWAPDGSAWMGDGSRLYRWQPGGEAFTEVADLEAHGIYGITRLAFSPGGDRLVVVGNRAPADLEAAYRRDAGRILGAALTDAEGWEKITHLATVIGPRLSGSDALEEAIDWAAGRMEAEGLTVRKQPVMVPHWVRGSERAAVVSPIERELEILGLGNSVGTPEGASPRRWSSSRASRSSRRSGVKGSKARSSSTPSSGKGTGAPCSSGAAGRRGRRRSARSRR